MAENRRNDMKVRFVSDEKIAETSSKGNQEKYFDADTDRWYKLDQFGYEALSETAVSLFLEKSNVEKDFPFRFVRYRMEKVNAHGHERTGCSSENFLTQGESIITLARLYRQELAEPLSTLLGRLSSDKKRVEYLAAQTAELTGLADFGSYLEILFETDAMFLNDDRHLNNIAVLEKDGKFDYCPIFDNGAALLSNMQIYRTDIEPQALIRSLRARPLGTTFNRQLIDVREKYGARFRMPRLTEEEIKDALAPMLDFYPLRDRALIGERVCACILTRQKAL